MLIRVDEWQWIRVSRVLGRATTTTSSRAVLEALSLNIVFASVLSSRRISISWGMLTEMISRSPSLSMYQTRWIEFRSSKARERKEPSSSSYFSPSSSFFSSQNDRSFQGFNNRINQTNKLVLTWACRRFYGIRTFSCRCTDVVRVRLVIGLNIAVLKSEVNRCCLRERKQSIGWQTFSSSRQGKTSILIER